MNWKKKYKKMTNFILRYYKIMTTTIDKYDKDLIFYRVCLKKLIFDKIQNIKRKEIEIEISGKEDEIKNIEMNDIITFLENNKKFINLKLYNFIVENNKYFNNFFENFDKLINIFYTKYEDEKLKLAILINSIYIIKNLKITNKILKNYNIPEEKYRKLRKHVSFCLDCSGELIYDDKDLIEFDALCKEHIKD